MRKAMLVLVGLMLIMVGTLSVGSTKGPTGSPGIPLNVADSIITPNVTPPPWTVILDANSISVSDASPQVAGSVARTFNVGAIINASSTTSLTGVFGWQFGIIYDNTTLVPQGDPTGTGNDAAQSTVQFGTQTGTGNPNWAHIMSSAQAFGGFKILPVNASEQEILVYFAILAPNLPVDIAPVLSSSVKGNLLASVAFELLRKPSIPVTLSVSDLQFADSAGNEISNIVPGASITETITNDPPQASFTFTHTGTSYNFTSTSTDSEGTISSNGYYWDFGDGNRALAAGSTVTHDYGLSGGRSAPGLFTTTLRVVDSQGATGAARDSGGEVIFNGQPSHASSALGLVELGPTAAFTFDPATPTSGSPVSFDALSSAYSDEPVVAGQAPVGGASLAIDPLILFDDKNSNGVWDQGEPVVYDNGTTPGVYDITDLVISGVPNLGDTLASDPRIAFVDANNDGVWNSGELIVYDSNNNLIYDGITSYSWDFGDLSSGSGLATTHVYATGGLYIVGLTVTDNLGATSTTSKTLTVANRPPTVTFQESTSNTFRNQPITLTLSAIDPDGTVTSVQVDWGDGTIDSLPGTATTATHSYVGSGTYTVTVTATDNDGATSTPAQATETVIDASPIATFTESATTVSTGTVVSFDGSNSNDPDGIITNYLWSFGDGATSSGVTANHTYGTAGSYIVTLTVTDNATLTDTATAVKTVIDRVPVASFSESATRTLTDVPISFDASASFDPDGTVTSYTWDFGDGASPGAGVSPSHTYTAAGTYIVTLTVMDNNGNTNTSVATKAIDDRPPTVGFTETATTAMTLNDIGLTITSSDSDGTVITTTVDWGDSQVDILAGATASDSHSYATAGSYTVNVTVADNSGNEASSSAVKTITDRPPSPLFSESSTTIVVGGSIHFDATGSSDPDGTIIAYSWDFGDDTTGTGRTVDHAYSAASSFTVTLTVTDDSGSSATTTAVKTIIAPDVPPTVSFTEDKTVAFRLENMTLSITSSDIDGTVASLKVDWGDGVTDALATSSPATASHAYLALGTYKVTVTATDNAGLTATASSTKMVVDRLPTALFSESSTQAVAGKAISFDASQSTDPDGTITSYTWDFGDGTTGIGVLTSHTWASAGTYTVMLTVEDNDGSTATTTATKIIISPVFEPAFTESATTTLTLSGITFDASNSQDNTGTITLYQWDFGDDSPFVIGQVTVDHAYTKAGTYTTILTIQDDQGQSGTAASTKIIQDRPPTATLTEDKTTSLTLEAVKFDASLSSDADGTVVSYSWDFGDGSTGSGAVASHSYTLAGTYTVTLTVTDDNGMTSSQASTNIISDRPPSVSFSEDRTTVLTGETINLTITSSDVDGTVSGTQVNWGDGTVDNLSSASTGDSHSYTQAGSYTVTITVTDDAGLTSSSQATKTVNDRPPVASFTESSTTVLTSVSISFDASASSDPDGRIISYAWDFGDGSTDIGTTISHNYAAAGTYVVTFTLTDDSGSTNSMSALKTVTDRPPVAGFTESTTSVPPGTLIQFDASTSTDPDGAIVTYSWDFGDGSTSVGITTSHSYAVAGTYKVVLAITDDSGSGDSAFALKTVIDRSPLANFTESVTSASTGVPISFDASGSIDPDGTIVSYAWSFGDGSTGTDQSTVHSYARAGTYTVALTVTDDSGNSDISSGAKTIADRPPVASFTESSTQALTNVAISFDAAGSSDPVGTIAIYAWDFGDGSIGSGLTVSHAYANAGSYTVNLTVTDDSGNTGTLSAAKTILDRPPVPNFTVSATTVGLGSPISFDSSCSSDPDGVVAGYSWNFGDGSNGSSAIISHIYNTTGSFTVVLVVTDDSGLTGTTSQVVSVVPPPKVFLTFEAYDASNFKDGIGLLDVSLNGQLVVNVPGGLFQLSGTGHYGPFANIWVTLGPFEVTNLVVRGTNTLVFSDPLKSHTTLIRNVKVVSGDSMVLLDYENVREVTPGESVTLTFSNPPLQLSSLTVSSAAVFVTEDRSFTATYEGGVGPFSCTFNFGDGGSTLVYSAGQGCSTTHTYWLGDENTWWDAEGNFTPTVRVVGANSGEFVEGRLHVEVQRQPSFTGSGLTWTKSVTTGILTMNGQVTNPSRVDLVTRVDLAIYTPSGGMEPFTSPSFLLLAGQIRSNISFSYTLAAHGWYCFQATLTYGIDLNHDGVLQDSEVLGTKHAEYGCFQVS